MKIIVTGKGGAGKTTVAGTLARLVARSGPKVIAVDCDPSPNLGITLGMEPDAVETMQPVMNGLLARGLTHHDPKPETEALLDEFGVDVADGIRLVATGRIEPIDDACMCCGSHATTRELFGDIDDTGRVVVGDLEAGLNDLIWARPEPAHLVLAVAEPSAKSVDIARRACRIAESLGVGAVYGIANRCPDEAHRARVEEILGVPVLAVPVDPVIDDADRRGVAPVDVDDRAPGVVAVGEVMARLVQPHLDRESALSN